MKTKNRTRNIATVGRLVGKPWLACSTDDMSPALNHVAFINGKLYASNGHIAICQDLRVVHGLSDEDVQNMEGKFIHREALKQINSFSVVEWKSDGVCCRKFEYEVVFKYSALDKFPDIQKVVPKEQESLPFIGINSSLLAMVGKSIYCESGTKNMKLSFYGKTKAIIVSYQSIPTEHQWALLMPVLLGGAE